MFLYFAKNIAPTAMNTITTNAIVPIPVFGKSSCATVVSSFC